MLFGGNRLGPRLWLFATFMVVFGAHFSALWILMANSWMQTPQGYEIVNDPAPARAVMTDFWQVVFTPSFIPRLLHVCVASWTVGAALMLSVSAWYLLKKRHVELAKSNFRLALPVLHPLRDRRTSSSSAPTMAIEVTHNQPLKLGLDGGPLAEPIVRAAVRRRAGSTTATQTTTRDLDPVPAQLPRLLQTPHAYGPGHRTTSPRTRRRRSTSLFQVYHFMFTMGLAVRAAIGVLAGLMFLVEAAARSARRIAALVLWLLVITVFFGRGGDHRRLVDGRDRAPAVGRLQRPARPPTASRPS